MREVKVADVPLAALAIQPPQVAAGGGTPQINPFQAGVDIFRMAEMANQIKLQNLQFQANSAIGDIMSSYGTDTEAGIAAVSRSPLLRDWCRCGMHTRGMHRKRRLVGLRLM